MRKSLPIAFVLSVFTLAAAAFALAPTIHNQVTQASRPLHRQADPDAASSGRTVADAPSQSALLDGKSAGQDRHTPRPPLFHICQEQDPTAVSARLGKVCYPLPY